MFGYMEVAENVYEGVTPYKITNYREYANLTSHDRKRKGGKYESPINPKKRRTRNPKKNDAGHLRDQSTGEKICFLHGPGHSTEEGN